MTQLTDRRRELPLHVTREAADMIEELTAALLKYGTHTNTPEEGACRMNVRLGKPCVCGWSKALARVKEEG